MIEIKSIWDNEGKTCDRYSVVLNTPYNDFEKNMYECLGLSSNPECPQGGISQFCGAMEGTHLGKRIKFNKLPKNIQEHIKWRLA